MKWREYPAAFRRGYMRSRRLNNLRSFLAYENAVGHRKT